MCNYWRSIHFYRPQRSWGKVMFLLVSVILFTGGVCILARTEADPPQTPPGSSPQPQKETRKTPIKKPGRPPPRKKPGRTPLLPGRGQEDPPLEQCMHTCLKFFLHWLPQKRTLGYKLW